MSRTKKDRRDREFDKEKKLGRKSFGKKKKKNNFPKNIPARRVLDDYSMDQDD